MIGVIARLLDGWQVSKVDSQWYRNGWTEPMSDGEVAIIRQHQADVHTDRHPPVYDLPDTRSIIDGPSGGPPRPMSDGEAAIIRQHPGEDVIQLRGHAYRYGRCECGATPTGVKRLGYEEWHRGHKRDVLERIAASLP